MSVARPHAGRRNVPRQALLSHSQALTTIVARASQRRMNTSCPGIFFSDSVLSVPSSRRHVSVRPALKPALPGLALAPRGFPSGHLSHGAGLGFREQACRSGRPYRLAGRRAAPASRTSGDEPTAEPLLPGSLLCQGVGHARPFYSRFSTIPRQSPRREAHWCEADADRRRRPGGQTPQRCNQFPRSRSRRWTPSRRLQEGRVQMGGGGVHRPDAGSTVACMPCTQLPAARHDGLQSPSPHHAPIRSARSSGFFRPANTILVPAGKGKRGVLACAVLTSDGAPRPAGGKAADNSPRWRGRPRRKRSQRCCRCIRCSARTLTGDVLLGVQQVLVQGVLAPDHGLVLVGLAEGVAFAGAGHTPEQAAQVGALQKVRGVSRVTRRAKPEPRSLGRRGTRAPRRGP